MKKVAVLFSGGLDSTYLVWKNLKDGNKVFPIYVEIENNVIKTILEKNRTNLLWEEFVKEFNSTDTYEKNIYDIHHAISVGVKAHEDSLYFKQIPIWIFSLMFLQSMDVDEIQIGYVANDDAIPYLNDIKKIYRSYQPICEPLKPLVFPLTKTKKWQMVQELPKQYMDLIFSCENAKIIGDENAEIIQYEPCCECVPCRTIMSTDYYGSGEFPKIYHNGLLHQYARQLRRLEYKVVDNDGIDYYEKMSILEPRKESYQLTIDFDCVEVEYKTEKQYNG